MKTKVLGRRNDILGCSSWVELGLFGGRAKAKARADDGGEGKT